MAQRRDSSRKRVPISPAPDEEMLQDIGTSTGEPDSHLREMAEEEDLPAYVDTEDAILATGDVVAAKMTLEGYVSGVKSWGAYEFRTRVMDGESEQEVADRVIGVVNQRVLDLLTDMDERLK